MKARDDLMTVINSKKPEGMRSSESAFRILVADDSTTMRKIVGQHLKSEMYEICGEAANGQEAVELFKELSPDAVTLDINMPIMDGIAALKEILAYDKDARIVMVTSEGQRESVIDAIKMGARGYIVKPPNKAIVCEKVKFAING